MSFESQEGLVTIEEAAEILGLKRSQTRAVLGEPYTVWQTAAGRIQYVYQRDQVEYIKSRRDEIIEKRIKQRGYRSCYYCKLKFSRKELCDGLCADCQARKIVRNFACHGDCFRHELDAQRLRILSSAINRLKSENGH